VPYESTHKFDVTVKAPTAPAQTKKILEGKNHKLCFDTKANYTITPQSCYRFGKQPDTQLPFSFDTSSNKSKALSFKPTFFKVEGKLLL
jgi:hypothetical protein